MSANSEMLEKALDAFVADQSQENRVAMVAALLQSRFYLPGVFPPGTDLSKIKPQTPNGKVLLPPNMRPAPAMIKNGNGELYLPAYTSREAIGPDVKFQVIMELPMLAVADMAIKNPKLSGAAINPFKQNILLKPEFLKALIADAARMNAAKAAANLKPAQKPGELKASARRQAETKLLPGEFYKDPVAFMEALENDEGEFILPLMAKAYGPGTPCPYKADAFSVMALNIRDDLELIRLDMPEDKKAPERTLRAFLLLNREKAISDWYSLDIVGKPAERKLFRATEDGSCTEICDAPPSGSEMTRILELYDENHSTL